MWHWNVRLNVFLGLWGIFLLPSAFALSPPQSYVTIYVYPSYRPINWSTPKTALGSFLGMVVKRKLKSDRLVSFRSDEGEFGTISSNYISTMGHTVANVQCNLPKGAGRFERWTSFSGQDYEDVDSDNILKKDLGLGVLFYDYVDGHLISGEENIKRITHYKGLRRENSRGGIDEVRPRYLKVEINESACNRIKNMIEFFEGFHFKPGTPLEDLLRRPEKRVLYFSSRLDPYETYLRRLQNPDAKVGGGCAPYGVAILKAAGRFSPELERSWSRTTMISEKLIGGQLDQRTGKWNSVDAFSLLLGDLGSSWNIAGYENRELKVADPTLIWNFIGSVRDCLDGKKCRPKAWLENRPGMLTKGPTHIFRDKIRKKTLVQDVHKGTSLEEETINVRQPVDGIVWRLPRVN